MTEQKEKDPVKQEAKPEEKKKAKVPLQERLNAEKEKLDGMKAELEEHKQAILDQQKVVDSLIQEAPVDSPHQTLQKYFKAVQETETKKAAEAEAIRKAALEKLVGK